VRWAFDFNRLTYLAFNRCAPPHFETTPGRFVKTDICAVKTNLKQVVFE